MSIFDDYEDAEVRVTPVLLLLDTSGSMKEDGKIDSLNLSVRQMIKTLRTEDAQVGRILLSLITFGGQSAKLVLENVPVGEVKFQDLLASGKTPIGQAFKIAREVLENNEKLPISSYYPTVALVSDGKPTDEDWLIELDNFLLSERGNKATKFALSIGDDADQEMLKKFSPWVYQAHEAGEIVNFLNLVTETITNFTLLESEYSDFYTSLTPDQTTETEDDV